MSKQNSLTIFVSAGQNAWVKKDAGSISRYFNDVNKEVADFGRGVRENIAPFRWINEKVFSGYGSQMEELRNVDENINKWTRDLDNVLDQAKDARKQGRYLDVFIWLNQINQRMLLANEAAKEFSDVNQEQFDEYFSRSDHGLQSDYFSKLTENDILDPSESFNNAVAATIHDEFVKTAGLFENMGNQLTTWKMERMYKRRLQEMKKAMDGLLGEASRTVGHVDAMIARMSKARANGDISTYLEALNKISAIQVKFEKSVKSVYETKGFKEMVQRMQTRAENEAKQKAISDKTVAPEAPAVPEIPIAPANEPQPVKEYEEPFVHTPEAFISAPQPNLPADPVVPAEPVRESVVDDISIPGQDDTIEVKTPSPEPLPEVTPPVEPAKKPARSRAKKSEVEQAMAKMSHAKFYQELEKASATAGPFLMAAMILKYSEQIDESDPDKSLELLAIAEGILNA